MIFWHPYELIIGYLILAHRLDTLLSVLYRNLRCSYIDNCKRDIRFRTTMSVFQIFSLFFRQPQKNQNRQATND